MNSRDTYQFTSPGNLFWRRLKEYYRNQTSILRSISDWTVWLYVLIPGGLLSGRLYYGLWVEGLPSWSEGLPAGLFPSLMLLVIYSASILLFIQEGDVLFIRVVRHWMSSIMLRGAIYSMAMIVIMIASVFIILLPFLVQRLDINTIEATSYLILSITTGWTVAWIRHLVSVNYVGWKRILLLILTLGLIGFIFVQGSNVWIQLPLRILLVSVVLMIIVTFLIKVRLKMKNTFMNDVQEDNKQRIKLTSLLLSQAVDKPRPTRTRTRIFKHSPYLYRSRSSDRRLAGAAVKALFRNPQHRKLYLQFTGACLLAIIWTPLVIKCLVLLTLYMMFTYWLYYYWISFLHDDWMMLLPWSTETISRARVVAIRTILLPYAVVMSIAFSLSWLGLMWGWLLILPLVIILYGLTSYIIIFLSLSRSHK